VDQQSALANLDQKPVSNGSGKNTTIPTTLTAPLVGPPAVLQQGSCSVATIPGTNTCPNNGANFGSVTGTIGGGRAVIMGLHFTY
jgi:hypothetical protein